MAKEPRALSSRHSFRAKLAERLQRISVGQLRAEREAEHRAAVHEAERIVRQAQTT